MKSSHLLLVGVAFFAFAKAYAQQPATPAVQLTKAVEQKDQDLEMSGEPTNENIDNTGNPRLSTPTLENMTNISDILEECHINLALS